MLLRKVRSPVNIGELKSDKKLEWIDIIKSNAPVFAGDRRLKVLDIGCGPSLLNNFLPSYLENP